MFEDFYQFSTNPFRLTPDPKFCFHHPSYDQAYAYLQYALKQGEGFVMVTGRPGIGKTTLVKTFIAELPDTDVITARIAAANVEATDLLCVVAHAYGVDYDHASKASLLLRLEEFFTRQARLGNRVLLIVDEAQGLPHSALEELRLLADLQLGSQPLLQLFLVGQEKLRELMREPEMEQFQQRVIGACHLDPLDLGETRAYIEHRLHKADWKGDPEMSGGALLAIFQYSKGIPRHINKICTRLLLGSFMKKAHTISKEDAATVAEELHSEELAPLENAANAAIDCSYDEDDELTISDLTLRMNPQQQVEQQVEAANPVSLESGAGQQANEAERETSGCDQIVARASSAQAQPQWNREIQGPIESPALHSRQAHTGIRAFSESVRNQSARGRAPVSHLKTPAPHQASRRPRSNGVTQKGMHRNRQAWTTKPLALFAALGGHASSTTRLLAAKINTAEKATLWSGALAILVLLVAVVAANFSDNDDSTPVSEQPTLALEPTPTQTLPEVTPPEPVPQGRLLAVQPLPQEATAEEPDVSERQTANNGTDKHSGAMEMVAVAPAIETRQPPEPQQPEPVATTEPLPSTPATTSTRPDMVTAVQTSPEPAAEAAPVVAPVAATKKVEKPAPPPPVKQTRAPVKKRVVAPAVAKEQKIAELLAHGWRSLRRDRLLIPKNNNAYHYFQRVLKLDPGNREARNGLDQIVSRYTALASTALDNNDRKKAERYIARGFRVNPDDQQLRALRDRMNAPPVEEVVSTPAPPPAVPEPEPEDYLTRFKAFLKTPPNKDLLAPSGP